MAPSSEAMQRHRTRRAFVYRRGVGWIFGAVLVVFAVKFLVSAGSWVGWQVTPQDGVGTPGLFKATACAPAGDGYRCTGAFREDESHRTYDDAVFVFSSRPVEGGLTPLYRSPDGGYSYGDPDEVTTGMLGGASMVFGAAALMVGSGIFFLATGYTPRPPRMYGSWSRWGRVSFGEAWQIVRSRAPLLWSIVGLCALGLVLLVVGPLVALLA
ncbi:hypothetical protein ACTWJ8_27855 [Streptomyces sp. SDT5-1]|uniref:hypothetical protein n=1 Tax=Streptomyces sp. SDT5-1 TaxID=3406418 RepID=UPI003FD0F2BA